MKKIVTIKKQKKNKPVRLNKKMQTAMRITKTKKLIQNNLYVRSLFLNCQRIAHSQGLPNRWIKSKTYQTWQLTRLRRLLTRRRALFWSKTRSIHNIKKWYFRKETVPESKKFTESTVKVKKWSIAAKWLQNPYARALKFQNLPGVHNGNLGYWDPTLPPTQAAAISTTLDEAVQYSQNSLLLKQVNSTVQDAIRLILMKNYTKILNIGQNRTVGTQLSRRQARWFGVKGNIAYLNSRKFVCNGGPKALKPEKRATRYFSRRLTFTKFNKKYLNLKRTNLIRRLFRHAVGGKGDRLFQFYKQFNMRLDVFLVQRLRLKNIQRARLFIRAGHVFINGRQAAYTNALVSHMDAVTFSFAALRWLRKIWDLRAKSRAAKKKSTFRSPKNRTRIKGVNNYVCRFARQGRNGIIYGPGRQYAVVWNLLRLRKARLDGLYKGVAYSDDQARYLLATAYF